MVLRLLTCNKTEFDWLDLCQNARESEQLAFVKLYDADLPELLSKLKNHTIDTIKAASNYINCQHTWFPIASASLSCSKTYLLRVV